MKIDPKIIAWTIQKIFVSLLLIFGFAGHSLADEFPIERMSFQNLVSSPVPQIIEVYCCSQRDGKVVVKFSGNTTDDVRARIKIEYDHEGGSGTEINDPVTVTKFVNFGEVRYSASPKYRGTYDVSIEFLIDQTLISVARFRQEH